MAPETTEQLIPQATEQCTSAPPAAQMPNPPTKRPAERAGGASREGRGRRSSPAKMQCVNE
eukprot:5899241-Alexandrium_andersonii.AAC.1